MITDIAMFVLEIIGTVAFAVSGALVSIRAKLDLLGVLLLGCITAVGGGIMRDILIGVFPPYIFSRWYIVLVAAVTSAVVFIVSYVHRHKFISLQKRIEHINNFFDALGLAAFTVTGTEMAFTHGLNGNMLISITLGVLTGVGGGVMRDILVNDTPYILKKHVYALVSIGGACLYYGLRIALDESVTAIVTPMIVIVVLRMLAAKYRWSLPKIQIDE